MDIVPKIKKLCNEKGVSISEFEREIGISENSSWRWDKNSPSIDKVVRAANYFGVSIGYLLGQEDSFVLFRKKKDDAQTENPPPKGDGPRNDREAGIIAQLHSVPENQREAAYTAVEALLRGLSLPSAGGEAKE